MRMPPVAAFLTIMLAAGLASASGPFGDAPRTLPDDLRARLAEQTAPLRDDVSRSTVQRRLAGEKAPATLNAIVLMCDFADSLMYGRHGAVPGDFPAPRQTDYYYAAHDSVYFAHLMQRVADYFDGVSGGRLAVAWTIHPRTVNLPGTMAFYGNHPQEGEQQILMAAQVVDSLGAEIDFTAYDTVVLVHAGAGQETDILGDSPEQIFSTYLDPDDFAAAAEDSILAQPYLPAPGFPAGTGIDRVLVLPETEQQDAITGLFDGRFGSLGVYCFEMGLHLGMLSLSDFTPSGRPDSQGIGQYGLMGHGLFVGLGYLPPQPCPYNKLLMGWLDPYPIDAFAGGTFGLAPANDPTDPRACARVDISGGEFWLLEYRLQDPDGNRSFTFGDDKNGNMFPDFWDADSELGNGMPTGKFDPATDEIERYVDAEWDFSMSENNGRDPALKQLGFGSGVYVWHVDEGLIQELYDAPATLFNADAAHKSVDLEEADGIQDLDSRQQSDYMLGGDGDSFRGESAPAFTAGGRPDTDTAAGAATGISFRDFSDVVVDSFMTPLFLVEQETIYAFDYADEMTFTVATGPVSTTAPVLHARRELPAGIDLRGSHVLAGDLDLLGGRDEIVLAGSGGTVWVFDEDLNDFPVDADPAVAEPFAVGTRGGAPVTWNLPPALGDIDGDGMPEIVLTGAGGLYAFEADGSATRDPEAGAFGLYADAPGCALPPVLVAAAGTADAVPDETTAAVALVVRQEADGAWLWAIGGSDGTEAAAVRLGAGLATAPPAVLGDMIVVAMADTAGGEHGLVVTRWTGGAFTTPDFRPMAGRPGPWAPLLGESPDGTPSVPLYMAAVVDTAGRGETVFFAEGQRAPRDSWRWSEDRPVETPPGLGGTFAAGDVLGRVGQGGDWLQGWPRRPLVGGLTGGTAEPAQALAARLAVGGGDLPDFIFATRDGRLFANGWQGEWRTDWPLAGPVTAGTPALARLGGLADRDLVAVGTFDRVTGTAADGTLATIPVATVSVWRDVTVGDPAWAMHGGTIWRNGWYDRAAWTGSPGVSAGSGLVSGSLRCYPSPLRRGPLKVGGRLRQEARVRAEVYNLEGELVNTSDWRQVGAADPFEIEVDVAGAVTGLYLCRLAVDTAGAGTEFEVTRFAIVR